MSLAEFQRAFADLIASPPRCLTARQDPARAFADYDLTSRERTRLHSMVLDEGMSINCTLYRANRLIPIYSVLPMTCRLLGRRLATELDGFAAASRDATLQYRWEAWRFGAWLLQRIETGLLPGGPIEDAVHFELAVFDARSAPEGSDGRRRLVLLHHDPDSLLDPTVEAASMRYLPEPVPVVIDASGGDLAVYRGLQGST